MYFKVKKKYVFWLGFTHTQKSRFRGGDSGIGGKKILALKLIISQFLYQWPATRYQIFVHSYTERTSRVLVLVLNQQSSTISLHFTRLDIAPGQRYFSTIDPMVMRVRKSCLLRKIFCRLSTKSTST